jgi:hypothetical protein
MEEAQWLRDEGIWSWLNLLRLYVFIGRDWIPGDRMEDGDEVKDNNSRFILVVNSNDFLLPK